MRKVLGPVPRRAPLLFAQLLFPGEGAAVVLLEAGLLFCFPSTWKKNKTGLMKNTRGKCFIISSSSPTALWHCSVIREDFFLSPLAPSVSPGPVGWEEADTLSFPVRSSSGPHPHRSTPPSPAQHWPQAQLSCRTYSVFGWWWEGLEILHTKHKQL